MLKLGRLNLDFPFFQSPLSGYSDYPMRKLARRFSAPLTFAGVMLAKSAAHPKMLRKDIFRPGDDEHPIGAQILGRNPKTMAKAAAELVNVGYDLIDLNFACPAPKILRRKRGGYLLKKPEKAIEIYRRVREAVSCPVTIKLRIGYGSGPQSQDDFWQIASHASEDGIDALIVHGRTVLQRFSGFADWKFLAKLKQQFPQTTIIGSGDLFNAEIAVELMREANIDGLAIARGAIGNPWIFSYLRAVLQNNPIPKEPDLSEQGRTILEHFESVCRIYEKKRAVRFFRKFLVRYCKLHPQRKKAQKLLLEVDGIDHLVATVKFWYGIN